MIARIRVRLAALLLLPGIASATGTRLALTIDPFQKPELEIEVAQAPAEAATEKAIEPLELPVLRAILHSSRTTLVNLNGELVAVGDSYQGYRVASVGDREAVLKANDETFVVSMDTELRTNIQCY